VNNFQALSNILITFLHKVSPGWLSLLLLGLASYKNCIDGWVSVLHLQWHVGDRNLLCVYSKKHLYDIPALAEMKRIANTRTLREMSALFRYIAILPHVTVPEWKCF